MNVDKEIPIAVGSSGFLGERLFKMWAGACAPTEIYVWEDSFESAFEELVEYLDDHAPGCLVSHDEFTERLDDAAREFGFADWFDPRIQAMSLDQSRGIVEMAEADLTTIGHTTLKNGAHIPSYEWGGDEIQSGSPEYQEVLARSLAEALESDIAQMCDELSDIRDECEQPCCKCRGCELDAECDHNVDRIDVRLALNPDGSWAIHSGQVCYDVRHAAYCGASVVCYDDTPESISETVRDLISQALDMVVQ